MLEYCDLSPVRQAAEKLAKKLPDSRTLGGEAWHFFHLQTEDFCSVVRTVQLACQTLSARSLCVPISEFYSWVAGPENANRKKTEDFDFATTLPDRDEIRQGNRIFVHMAFMDHDAKTYTKAYYQLLLEFIRFCENERAEQLWAQSAYKKRHEKSGTEQLPLSKQIFFIFYGTCCPLPIMLKNSLCTISYSALKKEDFRVLLQEYQERNELCKQERRAAYHLPPQDIQIKEYSDSILEWYSNNLAGMQELTVRRLLSDMRNAFQAGDVDYTKKEKIEPVIVDYKNSILQQHGRLEVQVVNRKDSVNGLETVDKWLTEHVDAMQIPADSPTGILLVGIPGTGKSATAKMVADKFNLSLVKLEMSRILGGRVGDSERGMQEMLEDLKFAAPCVLWIDEIEKAMSGADGKSGDNGVIQRLFGMLLTFMQENDRSVFTVTTANDISKLPPEFFRNGRFDQAFCVMMPEYHGCCQIMHTKLKKCTEKLHWNKTLSIYDAALIFDSCVGTKERPRFLTGADIEAHVQELFWHYKRTGKVPETAQELADQMKLISAHMRVQVSSSSPKSMRDIADRYLDMIQKGMTMAGNSKTPYISENLDLDAIHFYTFDENDPVLPSCIRLPEEKLSKYAKEKTYSNRPEEWYDAVFYQELVREMGRAVMYDKEDTLDQARAEYWKLQQYLKTND